MDGEFVLIYPDGTVTDETLEEPPVVGKKIGTHIVVRIETKKPDDEADTETWVYLRKEEW
jgi:hypothetical protein